METFGQKIRRLRKERRVTQTDLANAVGVDFTYISKIENGKGVRPPAEATIIRIAEFLDTNAEDLILLAKRVPQNFHNSIIDDKLAVRFLHILPKLNETQRDIIEKILEQAESQP